MLSQATNDAYRGRSVLITGGLEFIGSNLAHRLVQMEDVDVIDAVLESEARQ